MAKKVVLSGTRSRNTWFVMFFFCFEDPSEIEIVLCVAGTDLVESGRFFVANHSSVITRDLQVYGGLNCVCK